jgi:iron complex transport system ATP-binding protein
LNQVISHIVLISDLYVGYWKGREQISLLEGINVNIHKGELTAILGRNGTGKSTFLRTICGLQESISGKVIIQGTPIDDLSLAERAKKVSFVSTEPVHVSHMKIFDLIALGRAPYTGWLGRLSIHDQKIISDAISATGLSEKQDAFIDELSDGERQRAMIARALAQDTDIIYLDEPTAFLDVINRYDIFHLLHTLTRQKDKTIVFSTHDLQIALSESDRILLLENKRLIQGAPEDLLLSDEIRILFDREHLEFNRENATLSLKKDLTSEIGIEGPKSPELTFTIKALERLGFRVTDNKKMITVVIIRKTEEKTTWILQKKSGTSEFYSIYDLSLHLRNFSN